ncbi:glycoside hydrolase family 2 protein [Bifidobacterium eulemuris]|uniref:Beta-galactosidase n=1 Tax=Bifidobacterium eulemuris TaxID=1765219 RepID=A0A261GD87_9BIFI|nr:glycoside hydrolase family 2 TIM barrel-domain containing protein [Bifidobacterium eulemuris]OZG69223.1 beta-galactosidase [Bifidobacterium eulemuris]QOL31268.1 beta-galactosidase [Bifidobacterium eulemuris]
MRTTQTLHDGWLFTKDQIDGVPTCSDAKGWRPVTVPHSWNALDGQDGGADYWRGACWYVTELTLPESAPGTRTYLEFEGAATVAEVYVNGHKVAEHEGAYGAFRADVTDVLTDAANELAVRVDNAERSDIYPQMADFTFYGGLYRPVTVIQVNPTHFDLDYHAGPGVTVSSTIEDGNALLDARAWVSDPQEGDQVYFEVTDDCETIVAAATMPAAASVRTEITIPDAHLWQGTEDPYLYTVTASIVRHNEVVDQIEVAHGVREFRFDPAQGFFLNGKLTPLRGVSRHQDRLGKGNALEYADHFEDAALISELGANTIRLAHYQQSQDFYDLCDRFGFVVWAEIPFISRMNADPAAHRDCIHQMTELITQSFNHASILMWGISNEILIGGDSPQLVANLKELNDLAHRLDPTRPTTMAQVSSTPMDSEHNQITDILSYNHYFGWYGGKMEDNEAWVDQFHAMHPDRSFGLSEYGCEGIISYHTDDPQCGDYSEEYQALYHEHMADIIDQRPWLWGTHVWNMFDFGCDARNEGGVQGRNNKGLMTIDRKIRKDSFYVYQAHWSKEPMVHIASKRFAKRASDAITVKVYSNQPSVTLFVDGVEHATIVGSHVFSFADVPLHEGFTHISAKAGELTDSTTFEKVAEPWAPYVFVDPEGGAGVSNWFDDVNLDEVQAIGDIDETCFSVKDLINDIIANKEAAQVLANAASSMAGMRVKASMLGIMGNQSVESLLAEGGMMGGATENHSEKLAYINQQLQRIKK